MNAKTKGLLIEGTGGREYLLGFGPRPTGRTKGFTLSLRKPDGTFAALEAEREASKVARELLGSDILKPGYGKDVYLRLLYETAIAVFPKIGARSR